MHGGGLPFGHVCTGSHGGGLPFGHFSFSVSHGGGLPFGHFSFSGSHGGALPFGHIGRRYPGPGKFESGLLPDGTLELMSAPLLTGM